MKEVFRANLRSMLDLAASVAMIGVGGLVLWRGITEQSAATSRHSTETRRPVESIPTQPVPLDQMFTKGKTTARVAVIEYADLQCPACARFERETFHAFTAKYVDTGRVLFGFRHFPLPFHPLAKPAAIAAQCAGEQGKFWELYEAVFEDPSKLDNSGLQGLVRSLGIETSTWSRCLASASAITVDRDLESGRKLALVGTPTFIVGAVDAHGQLQATAKLFGARSLRDFDEAIDQAERVAKSIPRPAPAH